MCVVVVLALHLWADGLQPSEELGTVLNACACVSVCARIRGCACARACASVSVGVGIGACTCICAYAYAADAWATLVDFKLVVQLPCSRKTLSRQPPRLRDERTDAELRRSGGTTTALPAWRVHPPKRRQSAAATDIICGYFLFGASLVQVELVVQV